MIVGVDVAAKVLGREGDPHLLSAVSRVEGPALDLLHDPVGLLLHVEPCLGEDVLEPLLDTLARTPGNATVLLVHETADCFQEDAVNDLRLPAFLFDGHRLWLWR